MTNTPAQLSELVERVEAATGPDRELDARIRATLEMPEQPVLTDCPAYTASIDAALALVERKLPGTWWGMAKGKITQNEPTFGAALYPEGDPAENVLGEGAAESAPLAIILALLRALAHQGAE